ncbi:MAG: UDP-4-amino-4,6-dideoxy-N-acetyl-beta-L-altrosamine N-acetyltransferase [Planctomycetota bacterium]|nr:UDP-4-amino-4,6-dideoxy-N-acetyl-beta-L-altrosamine N-acetyltransferase [Planctomycetota bacterium]
MGTTLRPVEPGDRELIRCWRNQPDVARFMHTEHEITPEEHDRWFARMLIDDSVAYWVIELDQEPVGLVYLTQIDLRNERCSWAFYLASSTVRGRGVGSVVEFTILRHVFEHLGLQKLCCEVLDFNQPVIDMHASFGFVEEGRLRQHIRKPDRRCDVVLMAMLRSEWEAARPRLLQRLESKGLHAPELPGAGGAR